MGADVSRNCIPGHCADVLKVVKDALKVLDKVPLTKDQSDALQGARNKVSHAADVLG